MRFDKCLATKTMLLQHYDLCEFWKGLKILRSVDDVENQTKPHLFSLKFMFWLIQQNPIRGIKSLAGWDSQNVQGVPGENPLITITSRNSKRT